MFKVRCESDLSVCRELWQTLMPEEYITDLWDIRNCFHQHYRGELKFIVVEDHNEIVGFLPLCSLGSNGHFGFFPGETWKGHTWVEQNRIIVRDKEVFEHILQWLGQQKIHYHLRYILDNPTINDSSLPVDEIGYLFNPPEEQFNMDTYFSRFSSRKSLKSIRKDLKNFEDRGLEYRSNCEEDFDWMVQMNIDRFGETSYFSDPKFSQSFKDIMLYIKQQGWLEITSLLVGGELAAVDFGCIFKNKYTLLAGGTSPDFLGVAKVINVYHMNRGCQEKFDNVDFLCGDFSWKKIFHLTPRPLYLLSNSI